MPKGADNSDFKVDKVEQRVLDDVAYFCLRHRQITPDTLAGYAASRDPLERYVAASSPDTPVESLARLAHCNSEQVRMLVAANPSSTFEILMTVVNAGMTHAPTERNLGLHPLANDVLFAAMLKASRVVYATVEAVATAPDLTDARVAMLTTDWVCRRGDLTAYLAERADLSPAGMVTLIEAGALQAAYCLAVRRDLPTEVAAMLAVHEHAEIRERLLTNPTVGHEIVAMLAGDTDARIVELAARRLDSGEPAVQPAEVATWRAWTARYGWAAVYAN